jgi:pyruvate dehydrogenase E2 component (dihydrolipoamide acetyltransferase)
MERIIMPKLGLTMEEGTLVRWLKREGDQVEKGEILFEVETDKALNEVVASTSGTLGKILVQEGETVPVLQVIAFVLEPGEETPAKWPEVQVPIKSESAPAVGVTPPMEKRVTPIARRLAREQGIDLTQIEGTGAGGAVTKEDVLRVRGLESTPVSGRAERVPASPRAKRLAKEQGISLERILGSGPDGRITEQDVHEYLSKADLVRPSRLKQITATRMAQSFRAAPHFYLKVEADASQLVEWRSRLIETQTSVRITYTDLLVFLVARVLREHPLVNAAWEGGLIRTFSEINIGIAAAVEDGLTVPVIKHADQKSVEQIAHQRKELAEKAAQSRLAVEDLEGGTFTVTNLGMFGIDEFAAIINPPLSAILAVGRIAERAVVERGKVVVKPTVHLVLSIDHRVLDGVEATRFLTALKELIETAGKTETES